MSTALLRRRGAARVTGVLAACALTGTGVVASSSAAFAEEESVTETLQTFAAEAFAAQAEALPSDLVEAIERDLGLSAAEYLANAAAAKVAADVVAQLEADGVSINASIIEGQELTVYVDAEADVAAVEAVGASVEIGLPDLDTSGTEDQEFYAQDDFKGGYGYATVDDVEAPTAANRCSAGFNGTAADGSPVNYTAGHCGADFPEGHPWFHLQLDAPLFDNEDWAGPELLDRPLGENGPMHLGEGNDGGLLNITEEGWTAPPQVAFWGGGTGAPDDGQSINVYDSTDPIVGQPACKSGATSGWTCGEILFAEDTVPIGIGEGETADVTAFIFNACMLSGDSGGSIVSGNYALGVDSFSTAQSTATCDETNWNPATVYEEGGASDGDVGGGFQVTSGSANAETLFGDDFSLSIHVGAPSVTAPEDGGTTGQTPTISGSVEAAAGATVTVEIDGGPTVEGAVAADGSWSAEVTEALEPGEYSYTATASHTASGASEATTSDETTGSFVVEEGPEVEELVVDSPTEGQTTDNARPTFTGTGHPGGTVALTVGETAYGEAEVAEDGTWSITPSGDLPVGVRFDAVVTQSAEGETQEATVAGLGINAADVTITAPEDGSTVAGDVVFEGTSFANATIGLMLEGTAAASDEAQPRLGIRAEGEDDVEEWAGEFEIDDAGNWTFDPAEDLAEGEYTVTATATLEGGDPELSDSEAVATFTVSNEDGDAGGTDDGDEDLPDTGSSGTTWMIVGGVALLLAGGAAIALRARRNGTTA
ncbi:Ig-like domain-containing protein [Jiangella asiatica]|uniref:LPXTG cell wall anchor domain-containing protein n=1 Tax=Jiangella asiatica TaxID=2530372 RepID=A0A4R5DL98_9ACTN|nr:Ig-like domain-containing protein [Jiangella asiatica]TDE14996.1 LPXTG cell wall anchor domain-containing protein [Jiangella asiatica]